MGMNIGSGSGSNEPEVMMDINTTPLIDVMLVLLIMFIITIPIQLHAVNMDMPVGQNNPSTLEPNVVKLDVDERGTVFWNGEAVGEGAFDAQLLRTKLEGLRALPKEAQPEVHLRPNKKARYDRVAAVMAEVQRQGLTKFALLGSEQFVGAP